MHNVCFFFACITHANTRVLITPPSEGFGIVMELLEESLVELLLDLLEVGACNKFHPDS